MKVKQDSPIVAVIFKAFAVLSVACAAWKFVKGLSILGSGVPTIGDPAGAALALAFSFLASGLMLWWMGEVIELLGRIARNGEPAGESRSREKPARAELEKMIGSGKGAARRSDDDFSNPPKYEL